MTGGADTLTRMATEEGLSRLGEEIAAELERLEVEEDFGLPAVVVRAQRKLGHRSKMELQQLIVHAACALAVRMGGTATPGQILRWAAETAPAAEWHERVAPEIRKVWAAEGVPAVDPDDVEQVA